MLTNGQVREALQGSIRKWEKIVAGTGKDMGTDNCPLCAMFFYQIDVCNGCPVQVNSGVQRCLGTPYVAWDDRPRGSKKTDRIFAQTELDFLLSLDRKFFVEGVTVK